MGIQGEELGVESMLILFLTTLMWGTEHTSGYSIPGEDSIFWNGSEVVVRVCSGLTFWTLNLNLILPKASLSLQSLLDTAGSGPFSFPLLLTTLSPPFPRMTSRNFLRRNTTVPKKIFQHMCGVSPTVSLPLYHPRVGLSIGKPLYL